MTTMALVFYGYKMVKREKLTTKKGDEYHHAAANKYQNPTSTFLANLAGLSRPKKCQNPV